jgi:energy-converting hydrogenase A subunit M
MMVISALVVNVLYELRQIIEEARKNCAQNKQHNKIIQLQKIHSHPFA